MRNILLVARREYTQRIRTPAFIVTTLLLFVLLVGGPLVPAFISGLNAAKPMTVGVADNSGHGLLPRLEAALAERQSSLPVGGAGMSISLVPAATADTAALAQRVRDGELGAYLVIAGDWPWQLHVAGRAGSMLGVARLEQLRGALTDVAQADRIAALGITKASAEQLLAPIEVELGNLDSTDPEENPAPMIAAYIFSVLMYIGIILYGAYVFQGVLEEKTSRVMEVIASSVHPFQLMAGKILGLGLLGLTSYVSWLAAYIVLGLLGAAVAGLDLSAVPPSSMVYLGLFFALGYFLYAAMFAAAGSLISRMEDAGTAQTPAMLLIMGRMFLSMYAIPSPGSSLARITSLIPFFAPSVMLTRILNTTVPVWEIALSIVLLVLAVLGMIWVASRIYRVGILSYGSRPSLRQLIRYVRS